MLGLFDEYVRYKCWAILMSRLDVRAEAILTWERMRFLPWSNVRAGPFLHGERIKFIPWSDVRAGPF